MNHFLHCVYLFTERRHRRTGGSQRKLFAWSFWRILTIFVIIIYRLPFCRSAFAWSLLLFCCGLPWHSGFDQPSRWMCLSSLVPSSLSPSLSPSLPQHWVFLFELYQAGRRPCSFPEALCREREGESGHVCGVLPPSVTEYRGRDAPPALGICTSCLCFPLSVSRGNTLSPLLISAHLSVYQQRPRARGTNSQRLNAS